MTFEEDYFDQPRGTFRPEITALAEKFILDPYKAPEQRELAQDYLTRFRDSAWLKK